MERASYLIAVSRDTVEGGKISGGEGMAVLVQSVVSPESAHSPNGHAKEMLESFLQNAEWNRGYAILLLPTEAVSFRRLEFSFADAKKIHLVLPFELENELLDDLADYIYDFEIVPRGDGTAEAMVYLVRREYLQDLLDLCESHQLSLQKVTFAAQALVTAKSSSALHAFRLYSGSDETFIAYVEEGRMLAVDSIGAMPQRALAATGASDGKTPMRILEDIIAAKEDSPSEGPSRRALLAEELEKVCAAAKRFIRVYHPREPFQLKVEGLFGRFFRFSPESGELTLNLEDGGATVPASRPFQGILGELAQSGRVLARSKGVNFFRRIGNWSALVSDLKWRLAASVILAGLLAVVAGGNFLYQVSSQENRLERIQSELSRSLKIPRPLNSHTIKDALGKLRARLDKLKKEREASSHLAAYNYDSLILVRDISNIFKEMPQVTLEAMTSNRERFTLSGTTINYNESELLKTRLGNLAEFKDRNIKVTTSKSAKGISYRLSIER